MPEHKTKPCFQGGCCPLVEARHHIYIPKLNFIVSLIEITSPHFILYCHTIHMTTDKKPLTQGISVNCFFFSSFSFKLELVQKHKYRSVNKQATN